MFQILHIEPPLPGYSVEVLQWEVPVSLDGQMATLNGTVQQIYQQLLKIHPEYAAEIGIKKGFTSSLTDTRRSLGASEVQDTWTVCGHFDPARASAIWEGIDYLYTIDSKPGSKPGPRMCGQVSCSYDSAIWWCNDVSCSSSSFATVDGLNLVPQSDNPEFASHMFTLAGLLIL